MQVHCRATGRGTTTDRRGRDRSGGMVREPVHATLHHICACSPATRTAGLGLSVCADLAVTRVVVGGRPSGAHTNRYRGHAPAVCASVCPDQGTLRGSSMWH